jgi:hypothetical protein
MNAGILDATTLADALLKALAGDAAALDAYGALRRLAAKQVVASPTSRPAWPPKPGCACCATCCWARRDAGVRGRWPGGCRGWCTAERSRASQRNHRAARQRRARVAVKAA